MLAKRGSSANVQRSGAKAAADIESLWRGGIFCRTKGLFRPHDEWVIQILRQGDSRVFKEYSQMNSQMKREALGKINGQANEVAGVTAQQGAGDQGFDAVLTQ